MLDFAAGHAPTLLNPVTAILALRDSLKLNTDQVARLLAISDSLDIENRALSDSLQTEVAKLGDRSSSAEVRARQELKLAAERETIRQALERARSVLAPAQWAKLPDTLRSASALPKP